MTDCHPASMHPQHKLSSNTIYRHLGSCCIHAPVRPSRVISKYRIKHCRAITDLVVLEATSLWLFQPWPV
ncbi:uncharacterized protein ARMOST_19934 [Armillaria ostoyae]|uniref:Uncharacterized protein n=1 Tax=Armillaria ostoyae TaxID=47428 RepID=A0A284S5Z6_ARMOS|nr:uncharacterized protein ARMOST_19934 [Armillaria ostoyae]